MRIITKAGAVVLAGVFLLIAGCGNNEVETQQSPLVKTITVGEKDSENDTTFSGTVHGYYESPLAFQVSGQITNRYVQAGDRVRAGQPLFRVDSRDAMDQVDAARSSVISAQASYKLASSTLSRYQALHRENAISDLAMDQTQSQYDVAAAQLQQAKATLSRSQNNLGYTTLRADRNGVIGSTMYEVGQVVSAGTPVVLVVDDRQKEVHISLTEKQYNQYSVGMPCTVTFWALPNVIVHGVIKEKAASPDAATGTYDTKVSLADCPDEVTLGMTAQVSMDDNLSGNKSVVIPLTAIATQSSQPSVWVVENGRVKLVKVTVGKYGNDSVEITSGLKSGDKVVTAGASNLTQGEEVRV